MGGKHAVTPQTPLGRSPLIFGREPALYISLAASVIRLLAAFVVDLSDLQQSALNAVIVAAAGLLIAHIVHDGQVAAILGFVQALVSLAIGFGLKLDADAQAVIMSVVGTTVAMFTRTQVTAPVQPKTPPL